MRSSVHRMRLLSIANNIRDGIEELSDQQGARYDLYVEDCHNAGEAAMDFEEWEDML